MSWTFSTRSSPSSIRCLLLACRLLCLFIFCSSAPLSFHCCISGHNLTVVTNQVGSNGGYIHRISPSSEFSNSLSSSDQDLTGWFWRSLHTALASLNVISISFSSLDEARLAQLVLQQLFHASSAKVGSQRLICGSISDFTFSEGNNAFFQCLCIWTTITPLVIWIITPDAPDHITLGPFNRS